MFNSKEQNGQFFMRPEFMNLHSQQLPDQESSFLSQNQYSQISKHESTYHQPNAIQRLENMKLGHIARIESIKSDHEKIKSQGFPLIKNDQKLEEESMDSSPLPTIEHHSQKSKHAQIFQQQRKQYEKANDQNHKKIEELLKLEKEYKKEIEALKTNSALELANIIKKAESDIYQLRRKDRSQENAITQLENELERVNAINTSIMERNRSAQNNLSLRLFDLKRLESENHRLEDLLYTEKHKYLTSDIEVSRLKKQLNLFEKSKHYEREQFLRQSKLHEAEIEQPLKSKIAALTEELNLKSKRYVMLLQKWNSANGESKGTKEPVYEQNLNTMMGRISELEMKSKKQIEDHQNQLISVHKDYEQISKKYYAESTARQQLQQQLRSLHEENKMLRSGYQSLQTAHLAIIVEHKKLKEGESRQIEVLQEQISTLEREKAKLGREVTRLQKLVNEESRSHLLQTNSKVRIEKMSEFASPISSHKAESRMVETSQDENKELRRRIADLEFEVKRVGKINQQDQQLLKAAHEKQLDQLRRETRELKAVIETLRLNLSSVEIARNGRVNANVGANMDANVDANGVASNQEIQLLKEEHALKMKEMTRLVESLTVSNQKLLRDIGRSNGLLLETSELREFVRRLYHLNGQVDHLWAVKVKEYQNTEELLRTARAL